MTPQTSKKPNIDLPKGTMIKGKWHHQTYRVIERLGAGAIGTVYLCESSQKKVALKLSNHSHSLTSEVNVLRAFKQVQGHSLGPALLDVDDFVTNNNCIYTFYVMEYLSGEPLHDFIKKRGMEWIYSLLIGLLNDLQALHENGYVFGDLKLDNLLVTHKPTRLKWVDVGGTTQQGRLIKEYTEFYDRGYWHMGSRKAEPSYDLFALAMVVIRLFYPNGFLKRNDPKKTIQQKVYQNIREPLLQAFVMQLLQGKFHQAKEAKQFLLQSYLQQSKQPSQRKKQKQRSSQQNTSETEYPVFEIVSIFSVGGFLSIYVAIFLF
ncbi:serine:threonine protein kinase [Gracilibacillus halophilus YIM-C55.5]|uniref:Serine:threonine protein kinase n=1 Tax=Gracilibacillus halophilus YIM-C55.5 TaxID=1308866 RepID=N4WX47_9BACI|nr:protein kinase [Gracilibacillus halophilus]ENH97636.1 serine:threonine protein kinase [Gracilibacillus halophilus YIM-C55.5]